MDPRILCPSEAVPSCANYSQRYSRYARLEQRTIVLLTSSRLRAMQQLNSGSEQFETVKHTL